MIYSLNMKQKFKFSAALLKKESEAFSIIFQKSFRTEMEYVSNGKIKVTLFHLRTHKPKEINYFILEVFWSWFLIHRKLDFLPRCMKKYTVSLIHNCPIIYNLCLPLLNKDNFYVIIFLLVFSKPSFTCFNRTSLRVAFLSKYIFQLIVFKKKKKKDNTKPNKQANQPSKNNKRPPQQYN